MTDKTYTAAEFMVEFGNALAAFGAGKGPDPSWQWDCALPGGRWETRMDCPTFDLNAKYRWARGSQFAPHEKKRYITINGKVMKGGLLELVKDQFYYMPSYSRSVRVVACPAESAAIGGWVFATHEQAQAVADELDKLMWGEVR